jgi:hypothetical protein
MGLSMSRSSLGQSLESVYRCHDVSGDNRKQTITSIVARRGSHKHVLVPSHDTPRKGELKSNNYEILRSVKLLLFKGRSPKA